jgi:hypothetical protein
MSSNGVRIQEISDTVGHKSTHVPEIVYRHVIVPEIRGGPQWWTTSSTTAKTTHVRATKRSAAT